MHLVPISPSPPRTPSLTPTSLLEASSIRAALPLTATVVGHISTTPRSASSKPATPAYGRGLAIDQRETGFIFDMEVSESARSSASKGLSAFLPAASRSRSCSLVCG